jgi:hypothetical protein
MGEGVGEGSGLPVKLAEEGHVRGRRQKHGARAMPMPAVPVPWPRSEHALEVLDAMPERATVT